MQYRIVNESASGCLFCRASRPPYLDAMLSIPEVPTPAGPVPLEQEIHICIGTVDNPGCLPQMIAEAGGLDPFKWEAIKAQTGRTMQAYVDKIEQLEKDLAESREKEGVRVVPVSEVLDAITP